MKSVWPTGEQAYLNQRAERKFVTFQTLVRTVREIRKGYAISPLSDPSLSVKTRSDVETTEIMNELRRFTGLVGGFKIGSVGTNVTRPPSSIPILIDQLYGAGTAGYVALGENIDVNKGKEFLTAQINFLTAQLKGITQQLANKDFQSKAPKQVVESERAKRVQLESTIQRLKTYLVA